MDPEKIEKKISLVESGGIPVDTTGGVALRNVNETIEIAKWLAESDIAVPPAFRKKAGACWRVVMQSLDWGMPIYALMDSAYVVNDRVAYEAKVLHALIEKSGKLQARLRASYSGDGADRRCTVIGLFKGEAQPLEYESPRIADISPKNSPLWKTDPDQQLWYFSVRRWQKRWAPDVAYGFYGKDEAEDAGEFTGPERAKDVTPATKLSERLKGGKDKPGFNAKHIETETTALAGKAETTSSADPAKASEAPGAIAPVEPAASLAAPAVMEVSDAYALGEKLRADGKPYAVPPELAAEVLGPQRDAHKAGYEAT